MTNCSQKVAAVVGNLVVGTGELGLLRVQLRELLELLHWEHLDSWVDELLAEVRCPWAPRTPGSGSPTPPCTSI